MADNSTSASVSPWRWRSAKALLIIALVLTPIAVLGVWSKAVALNSNHWANASSKMLDDPAVRSRVSTVVVDRAFEKVNTDDLIAEDKPVVRAVARAGVVVLRKEAYTLVNKLLESDKFREAWKQANQDAHAEFMAIIDGRSTTIRETNGKVELDIRPLVRLAVEALGINGDVVNRIPDSRALLDLGLDDQLQQISSTVRLVRAAVIGLVLLAVLLVAGAIWLARGRRIRALTWAGTGLVIDGAVILAVRAIAGQIISQHVAHQPQGQTALADAWDILTQGLVTVGWVLIVVGIAMRLALWVAVAAPASPRVRAALDAASTAVNAHRSAATWTLVGAGFLFIVLFSHAMVEHVWLFLAIVLGAAGLIYALRHRAVSTLAKS